MDMIGYKIDRHTCQHFEQFMYFFVGGRTVTWSAGERYIIKVTWSSYVTCSRDQSLRCMITWWYGHMTNLPAMLLIFMKSRCSWAESRDYSAQGHVISFYGWIVLLQYIRNMISRRSRRSNWSLFKYCCCRIWLAPPNFISSKLTLLVPHRCGHATLLNILLFINA